MEWHVFKMDDPSTWPQIDCPMLMCASFDDWPEVYLWNRDEHTFENDYKEKKLGKCFYAYIGYLPYIEKECHPVKCSMNLPRCAHYDDGYCMSENKKCESAKVVTEYALGMKRIWKEFE